MSDRMVVVTGSTRGLGLGLAEAFLAAGTAVTVTGRSQAAVDKAIAPLAAKFGRNRVVGVACDVTNPAQVEGLWNAAAAPTGRVDIWVNNAGATTAHVPFAEISPEEIAACVQANLLGTMIGTRVALTKMKAQGSGQIFNLEGYGSAGQFRVGMSIYAPTKSAVRHFTKAVSSEAEGTGVCVGTIMPGLVVTDMSVARLQTSDAKERASAKKLYSVIGDPPEAVAAYLVPKILANAKNGAKITKLSPGLFFRFLSPRYRRRDLFPTVTS